MKRTQIDPKYYITNMIPYTARALSNKLSIKLDRKCMAEWKRAKTLDDKVKTLTYHLEIMWWRLRIIRKNGKRNFVRMNKRERESKRADYWYLRSYVKDYITPPGTIRFCSPFEHAIISTLKEMEEYAEERLV